MEVMIRTWPCSNMESKSRQCQKVRVAWLTPERSIAGLIRKLWVANEIGSPWRTLPQALVPECALFIRPLAGVPRVHCTSANSGSGTTVQSPTPSSRLSNQGGRGAGRVVKV